MATSKMIYMAGPIGDGHTAAPRKMYSNVRQAEKIMFQLMKKGWTVICPHLSYHCWINWDEDMPWERWIQMDRDFVSVCPYFFYMKPDKYGESKGAALEYEQAKKLGKMIYTDIDDVPEVLPETGAIVKPLLAKNA